VAERPDVCPGCGKQVRLLPPRAARRGRLAVGWRRKQHWLPNGNRCRHPVNLNTDEVAVAASTDLIRRLQKDATP
jgi:hypothetical protein